MMVGIVDKFLNDLSKSVTHVRTNPKKSSGIAPVYGMANSLPFKGIIQDLLKKYMENVHKIQRM